MLHAPPNCKTRITRTSTEQHLKSQLFACNLAIFLHLVIFVFAGTWGLRGHMHSICGGFQSCVGSDGTSPLARTSL